MTDRCTHVARDGLQKACERERGHDRKHVFVDSHGNHACVRCGMLCDNLYTCEEYMIYNDLAFNRGLSLVMRKVDIDLMVQGGIIPEFHIAPAFGLAITTWVPGWVYDVVRCSRNHSGCFMDESIIRVLKLLREDAVARAMVEAHPASVRKLLESNEY